MSGCHSTQSYKDISQLYASCTLCPRRCHANRLAGETGFCGQTLELRAARASLHMWEEPCISGAAGSGTVFFSGCNLRCIYCQNYDIALGQTGKDISPDRLVEIFLTLQQEGAANINLVTPTHFLPSIAWALEQARQRGLYLPVVYNCGGYESVEALQMLDGLVNIYLPDLKYVSGELSSRYSHAEDYFEKARLALDEMFRQVGAPEFYNPGAQKDNSHLFYADFARPVSVGYAAAVKPPASGHVSATGYMAADHPHASDAPSAEGHMSALQPHVSDAPSAESHTSALQPHVSDTPSAEGHMSALWPHASDAPSAESHISALRPHSCAAVYPPDTPLLRRGMIVRHLVLPGHVGDSKKVLHYLRDTFGNDIYVSVMCQYTPLCHVADLPELNRRVTPAEYQRVTDYCLRMGMENVYIQEGDVAQESFIPPFDLSGL